MQPDNFFVHLAYGSYMEKIYKILERKKKKTLAKS